MGASLALIVTIFGIATLFYLDRDRRVHTSAALWLPIAWISIVGSRPVTEWLGYGPLGAQANMEGSPLDRAVFQGLLAAAIIVLASRSQRTKRFLGVNWLILFYFAYCLLSVCWSDFPSIAFKRWIKAIGDLAMVLVIVTDRQPVAALRRVISRAGFILLPMSVLLIRYFGNLGRGYDPDGQPMNTGVSNNKNTLGVLTLVIALGALWQFLSFLRDRQLPYRRRHLFAQGVLTVFGIVLLLLANSATSLACFLVGGTLLVLTSGRVFRRRPAAIHVLVLSMIFVSGVAMLFGGQEAVIHALGRQTNLTGRSNIWAAVLTSVHNPIIGTGFESFWLGPRLNEVWSRLSQYMHVNEAHNGYIEMYLNLGWIGVFFIAAILISSYQGAVAAFRRDAAFGSLMLAYVAAGAMYGVTEAGFRMLNPMWIFLLLALVGAKGMAAGLGTQKTSRAPQLAPADVSSSETYVISRAF